KNIYSLSIPTNGCACSYIFPEKSEKIIEDMKDYESFNVKAYPNPFTNRLFFEVQSPVNTYGRLEIFDITGSKLKILFDGNLMAGQNYKVEYIPEIISSGMIFYKMVTKGKIISGKVVYKGE
ncbi:MAG: T9SS type A sorting domain-containing protein, partial [Bacteroidales bacterium]|nr:T9SS type A sorting domain-containing protein [Bacteroidales bacterium]